MDKKPNRFDFIVGIAVILGLITGCLGISLATFALFKAEWIGVGLSLLAAAFAFGLLANALLRK
jgi:uncharacterized membrane protein